MPKVSCQFVPRPLFLSPARLLTGLTFIATVGMTGGAVERARAASACDRVPVYRGRFYELPNLGMTKRQARAAYGRPHCRLFGDAKQQKWVYQRVSLDNGVRILQEDILLFDREGRVIGVLWGTMRSGVRLEG